MDGQQVTFPRRARGGVLGGALLVAGPTQFLLLERVTAAAWRSPGYSFVSNFISDLGVTGGTIVHQGRVVDSPVAWLMNVSFIAFGLLGGSGILLLSRSLDAGGYRLWIQVIGVVFGVGGVLVGLFPENAVPWAHALGAFLNIGIGNALLITVGVGGRRFGLPLWLAVVTAAAGAGGAAAAISLVSFPPLSTGAVERAAVYPYTVALIVMGVLALEQLVRQSRWTTRPLTPGT